jgi:tripartite-type tricarboxylate transporter receptor subunit TctC
MRRRCDVRILTVLLAWIITLLATSNLALAAPYPKRYLTLIFPVSVGGAGDFMGRLIADRLPNALGEKVIVDNRGGCVCRQLKRGRSGGEVRPGWRVN